MDSPCSYFKSLSNPVDVPTKYMNGYFLLASVTWLTFSIASATGSDKGPEFPIQVMQP